MSEMGVAVAKSMTSRDESMRNVTPEARLLPRAEEYLAGKDRVLGKVAFDRKNGHTTAMVTAYDGLSTMGKAEGDMGLEPTVAALQDALVSQFPSVEDLRVAYRAPQGEHPGYLRADDREYSFVSTVDANNADRGQAVETALVNAVEYHLAKQMEKRLQDQ